ncbi:muscarinic acetylcholine receptor gar-3-like [Patiria miniata]|uniref:G-protein coupled receptors family 1 profile domain-containing protein n=1 Tax=Patiria miniata TaxID=46514 RepID=A0A913Z4M5_PATMI|nr:muscarinic acetylcholine receptor gar-3-like [Patiria miniata]
MACGTQLEYLMRKDHRKCVYGFAWPFCPLYLALIKMDISSEVFNTSDFIADELPSTTSTFRTVCISLVVGLIVLVTTVGNILVIASFVSDRRIRAAMGNWFILNLSICDLTTGVAVLPFNTHWVIVGRWSFGEAFCKLWLIVDFSITHISILSVIFISLDRYWMVTKTSKYRSFLSKKKVQTMTAAAWSVIVIYYTFVALAWAPLTKESPFNYDEDCELDAVLNMYFTIVQIIFEFVLPLIVITYLNLIVYTEIKRRSGGLKRMAHASLKMEGIQAPSKIQSTIKRVRMCSVKPLGIKHDEAMASLDSGSDYDIRQIDSQNSAVATAAENKGPGSACPGDHDSVKTFPYCEQERSVIDTSTVSSHRQMPADVENKRHSIGLTESRKSDRRNQTVTHKEFKKHRKAAITLAALVIVFVICWLPYHITAAWNMICRGCVGDLAWEVVNYMLWCNSTVNPFLYAITNVRFRRNFIRFLGCRRLLRQGRRPVSDTL